MAYELHIIRRRSPGAPDQPIAREEWCDYLDSDAEFRRIDAVEAMNPKTGAVIRIPGNAMAIWTARGEPGPVFGYFEDRISVSFHGRDDGAIAKMKEIAAALDAIVVGDEGEEY